MATWHILGIAGGILLVLAVLKLAWPGRRVGENACCAKCDYLLVGLPETSERCPECGTAISLTSGLNVRAGGSRRRSVGWVMVCLVLIIAGVWWEQQQVRGWFSRPAARKPNWLLFHDVKSTTAGVREAALVELLARDGKGHIDSSRHGQLVDAVLAAMRLPRFGWSGYEDDGIYDWMVAARGDKKVSDAQWKQFFDLHPPTYHMRPVVSSIEPFTIEDRGGLGWGCTRSADYAIKSAVVDGQPVKVAKDAGYDVIDLAKELPNLPAGKHEIILEITGHVYGRKLTERDHWTGTAKLSFEYRTDGQTSVERKTSDADISLLSNAIKPQFTLKANQLNIAFNYPSGLPMCHDAYLRFGDRVERIYLLQGGNTCGMSTSRDNLLTAKTTKVEVILKPNLAAAARSVQITSLVDREIVLKDLPVTVVPIP